MAAQPQSTYYTVEEYLKLDRESLDARYEYYDGSIRMMSGGTSSHSLISGNVNVILNNVLADSPCGVFNSDMRVQIDAARYVYPDLSVSCDSEDFRGETLHSPVIILEVLSPSTASFDRGRKAEYYRAVPSLIEYVLIEQDRMSVEVQRRFNETALWTIENYGEGESITLTSLNVTLAVNDLYRKVVFPEDAGQSFPEAHTS